MRIPQTMKAQYDAMSTSAAMVTALFRGNVAIPTAIRLHYAD